MRRLIQRFGGAPRVAPSMREVPLEDQREALQFAQRLFDGTIDVVILLTGVGTRVLLHTLLKRSPLPELAQALGRVGLVARGPKPIVALTEFGLKPTLIVPEPNTWREILATLDAHLPVTGRRVAVQEYGVSNPELLDGLASRGAEVLRVPVYQWALPEDLEPLQQAVRAICAGEADVLLFTSATQLEHVMRVAKTMKLDDAYRQAARRCVIASVGPMCTEALTRRGFPVDLEPAHPKLGSLLAEAARSSRAILQRKRGSVTPI
ncbi:MAG: uroporphyrinogen III synthase HEM4 [Candidatus Omnitrophica bacterium CG11_big_fil_rev_8_21_14_0_20_63_9]|nr:MAG: uroporphyrinogen III synthase HEM4 [Candidatus Omnitrophica bacterium CG11_big_fil_rev_8_21_14_0_20_63_9]